MGVAPTFLRGREKGGGREAGRATWRKSAELYTIVMWYRESITRIGANLARVK